jgi:membrane-associated HD superfamily phosphohydrolase
MLKEGKDLALIPPMHAHSLFRVLSTFEPKNLRQFALYQDLLQHTNQLTEARFKRLNSVQGSTSSFLWGILIYGAFIVIGCTFLFASKSKAEHILLIIFNVSFLTLVLLLIYCLDAHFTGPTSIDMAPFTQVLEQMDGFELAYKLQ